MNDTIRITGINLARFGNLRILRNGFFRVVAKGNQPKSTNVLSVAKQQCTIECIIREEINYHIKMKLTDIFGVIGQTIEPIIP